MKAVIMAGGKGTRLRPLTCNTPKPMVPLLDRPVMEYTIELLKKHGIIDIAVTIQYIPNAIRQYFGDGEEFGVHLHYFEEDVPLGTAGSVKNAEAFLNETFIVISGDALTDFDLTEAIAYHNKKKAVGTLLLTHVDSPLEYGVVMTDEKGSIIRFLEKPSWGEVFSDTVNTGIYIMEPEIFTYFDKGKEFDFSKELFPLLLKKKRPLYGYVAAGYWSDIGNLHQYRNTQFDMLDGKVQVRIQGTEAAPRVWVGENAQLDPGAVVKAPAFIGRDCVLEKKASLGEYSIIGERSLIKQGASVERTIVWNNGFIDQQAELSGATICSHVKLRTGAVVGKDAVLGDGCEIGLKSIVQSGVKIYPNKSVGEYKNLNHSLIREDTVSASLFGRMGVRGTCNVDMTVFFANRLASAFGTTLSSGAAVGIGHDVSAFSRLLAESFAAGLNACGIHTYDFGAATSSVTRYAVSQSDCSGGIHVRQFPDGTEDQYVLEFIDRQGLPIDKGTERKIENAYYQEDYRLAQPHVLGKRFSRLHAGATYLENLLATVNRSAIQERGYKVVLDYHFQYLNNILPELLGSLECRFIQLHRVTSSAQEMAELVCSNGADLGIVLDPDAQQIVLVTEKGEVVRDDILFLLQTMIQIHNQERSMLHVPVHAPNIVETIAEQYNLEVVRTKADPRSIMEGCRDAGFHVYFDGLYTLVQVMHMMALQEKSLSKWIETIPEFILLKRQVDCPSTEKGRVMRFLMEESKGKQVELIDGIKVYHENGWTLILPDYDKPAFQVYSNAENGQIAEELTLNYTKKILDYQKA